MRQWFSIASLGRFASCFRFRVAHQRATSTLVRIGLVRVVSRSSMIGALWAKRSQPCSLISRSFCVTKVTADQYGWLQLRSQDFVGR